MCGAVTVPWWGRDAALADSGDFCLFVDGDAGKFDRTGETAHQFRRLNPGDAAQHQRPERVPDPDAACEALGADQFQPILRSSPCQRFVMIGAQPLHLGGVAGNSQFIGPVDVCVDALGPGDRDHLVHRVQKRPFQIYDALARRGPGVPLAVPAEPARQPAAVAARGAEPGPFPLDDGDREIRRVLLQVPRGPEASVACADDANVGRAVSGQGSAHRWRSAHVPVPERNFAVSERLHSRRWEAEAIPPRSWPSLPTRSGRGALRPDAPWRGRSPSPSALRCAGRSSPASTS